MSDRSSRNSRQDDDSARNEQLRQRNRHYTTSQKNNTEVNNTTVRPLSHRVGSNQTRKRQQAASSISRRTFAGIAGVSLVTAGAALFNRFFGFSRLFGTKPESVRSLFPTFLQYRLSHFNYPALPYVYGVWLDASRLIFGQIGETLELKVAVGSKEGSRRSLLDEAEYKTSDETIALVDQFGTVTACGYGECTITVGVGRYTATCQVRVIKKWAALTFDDGPGPGTKRLLDGLRERGVRASFFVLGNMAESRKSILSQMAADGHEVGNHTYSHRGGNDVLEWELTKTDEIIREATGSPAYLMRPPGGTVNKSMYSCGKPIILWSVDPLDWDVRNTDTVYNRVMNATTSGSVILLHDIYETTVDAAFLIMDALIAQGYTLVTISELFDNPQPGKVYGYGSTIPKPTKLISSDWVTP
jgi:peptidoglycan/xylan/chitin deacetylase (PgdA/CDA1 family)